MNTQVLNIEALLQNAQERASVVHSIEARPLSSAEDSDFELRMSVGLDDSQIDVRFLFTDTGNGDETPTYDVDTHICNGDHAGLDEQLDALRYAVAAFKANGFDRELLGRAIRVIGMS